MFSLSHSVGLQFEQFARTVGDAAVNHQQRIRNALHGFAEQISSSARRENATWPMYRLPDYEVHAGIRRLESGSELMRLSPFVEKKDEEEYLEFVTANYEDSVIEGHMILYGNTNRLNPVGYQPHFQSTGPNGFFPDPQDHDFPRGPFWQMSPRKSYCCILQFFGGSYS